MNSTEIFQEGIRLGPIKVVEGGIQRADVTDLLGRNSRFSYPAIGDLGAQIACARTGQKRLRAIIEQYGPETIAAAREEIFTQTERLEREAVAAIPDGVYSAEGCLDDSGVSPEPCWVRLSVEIRGEEMTIDLSESDDSQPGPVNCGEAQAISACRVAYKLLINPANPPNGGAFRPLHVRVRPGSMLGAQPPAPVPVVLLAARPADRPRRARARRRAAGAGGRRELRRLDGDRLLRHRPPQRPAVLRPRADGRRLGRVGRLRRPGRPDQQRQRLAQGSADRGLRDEVPDAHDPLRLPSRHRRAGAVARRQRRRPGVHARRGGGRAVALVRAVADARLGPLRRPRRRAAGRRDQPGPRGRAPHAEGEPPAASAGRRRTDDDRRRRRLRRSGASGIRRPCARTS